MESARKCWKTLGFVETLLLSLKLVRLHCIEQKKKLFIVREKRNLETCRIVETVFPYIKNITPESLKRIMGDLQ